MRITIVDNDAALLRSLELVLTEGGHRVSTFDDPRIACHAIETGAVVPDVLVVDYVMPGITGDEVLRRVRERLGSSCRVILISGHTDLIQPLDLQALGVCAFIPKPLDLSALTALVTHEDGASPTLRRES